VPPYGQCGSLITLSWHAAYQKQFSITFHTSERTDIVDGFIRVELFFGFFFWLLWFIQLFFSLGWISVCPHNGVSMQKAKVCHICQNNINNRNMLFGVGFGYQ